MLIVPFTPDLSSVKKQEIMNTRIILLILLAGSPFLLAAQAIYAVNDAAVITIEGTSTMPRLGNGDQKGVRKSRIHPGWK